MSRPTRRGRRAATVGRAGRGLRVATALACALALVYTWIPGSSATLTGSTSSTGQKWAAAAVPPPTSLTASRPCSSTPAPVWKATTSAKKTYGLRTITVNHPASVQNDLLIAFAANDDPGTAIVAPSGWNRIGTQDSASSLDVGVAVFWKLAPAAPPASYTFEVASILRDGGVVMMSYRGASTTYPIVDVASATGIPVYQGDGTFPASTKAVRAGTTLVAAMGQKYGGPPAPAGLSPRTYLDYDEGFLGAWDRTVTVDGTVPSITTPLGGNYISAWASLSVIIRPPIDPTVTLSWTAASKSFVTGYGFTRTGTAGSGTISGRTTVSYVDGTTSESSPQTYALSSQVGNWTSAAASATVTACR